MVPHPKPHPPPRLALASATLGLRAGPAITPSPSARPRIGWMRPPIEPSDACFCAPNLPSADRPLLSPSAYLDILLPARPAGSADCPGRPQSALSRHAVLLPNCRLSYPGQLGCWRSAIHTTHHGMSQWEIDLHRHGTLCHPSRSTVSLCQSRAGRSCRKPRGCQVKPCVSILVPNEIARTTRAEDI